MRIYQKICYAVEDIFVELLTKNQDRKEVSEKVNQYRREIKLKRGKKAKLNNI